MKANAALAHVFLLRPHSFARRKLAHGGQKAITGPSSTGARLLNDVSRCDGARLLVAEIFKSLNIFPQTKQFGIPRAEHLQADLPLGRLHGFLLRSLIV